MPKISRYTRRVLDGVVESGVITRLLREGVLFLFSSPSWFPFCFLIRLVPALLFHESCNGLEDIETGMHGELF